MNTVVASSVSDKLQDHTRKLAAAIEVMSLRERAMLLTVCGILSVTFFQLFWFDHIAKTRKQLGQQRDEVIEQRLAVQDQADNVLQVHNNDPNRALTAQLAAITANIQDVTEKMSTASSGLLKPEQVPTLLKGLIAEQAGLRLLRIETLPVLKVDVNGVVLATDRNKDGPALYRHGLELEVSGNFQAISHWLMAVEKVPTPIQWSSMRYTVEPNQTGVSPKARLVLRIYTLSLDEVWLSV